jgi:hypothetical protein
VLGFVVSDILAGLVAALSRTRSERHKLLLRTEPVTRDTHDVARLA